MSRGDLGEGGALRRGVSFVSQGVSEFKWEFNLRQAINDKNGIYAWTFDVDRKDENQKGLITARAMKKGNEWSVTDELQKIVEDNDAWLVAYYNQPQQAYVVDPNQYERIERRVRDGRDTYEYDISKFPSLSSWASQLSLRQKRQRKL